MRRKVTFYLNVWQVNDTKAGQNYHVLKNKLRFIKHNPLLSLKNFSSFVYSAPLKLHLKQYRLWDFCVTRSWQMLKLFESIDWFRTNFVSSLSWLYIRFRFEFNFFRWLVGLLVFSFFLLEEVSRYFCLNLS